MKHSTALAVMLKAPAAGSVKTRLVPPFTLDEAAEIYTYFIKDTFSSLSHLKDVDIISAVTPEGSLDEVAKLLPEGSLVRAQKGSNLGERLQKLIKELFNEGYERVAVIGADSPDLPVDYIENAFLTLRLNPGKLVIGPSKDGGYYIIAMDKFEARAFQDIPWSTPRTLETTVQNVGGSALLLSAWHDIDRASDIPLLVESEGAPESTRYILENGLLERCNDFMDGIYKGFGRGVSKDRDKL